MCQNKGLLTQCHTQMQFLKTSTIFLIFNKFNSCPFFLPNYFRTLFSCPGSKSILIRAITFVALSDNAFSNTFVKVVVSVHVPICSKNSGYGTLTYFLTTITVVQGESFSNVTSCGWCNQNYPLMPLKKVWKK